MKRRRREQYARRVCLSGSAPRRMPAVPGSRSSLVQTRRDRLAVECGLGLEHGQEHFGKTTERVRTAVWPASVQVSGQRVSMEAGSIGARHRPRYRPFSCLTAFRTPFLVKCQVLRPQVPLSIRGANHERARRQPHAPAPAQHLVQHSKPFNGCFRSNVVTTRMTALTPGWVATCGSRLSTGWMRMQGRT